MSNHSDHHKQKMIRILGDPFSEQTYKHVPEREARRVLKTAFDSDHKKDSEYIKLAKMGQGIKRLPPAFT
jgi:hypothetical protein